MKASFGLLLIASLSPMEAFCQEDSRSLPPVVVKALSVARQLRYSGTRTVTFREGTERRSHVEFILKDGPKSRIWFPPGSPHYGQVIIESGPKRVQYMPESDKVIETPARGDDALNRLSAIIRNVARFRVETEKGGPVAGFETQRANITDRRGNCIQSLWIEPKSGMVLKRELYDRVGAVVGSFEFTTVNFKPQFNRRDFEINRKVKQVRLHELFGELCQKHGFERLGLAKGADYDLQAVRVLNPKGRMPVLMQSYSGPRGVVTLFQVQGEVNPKRLETLARGSASTYSWKAFGKSLVLVGEASRSELVRLSGLVGKR